MDDESDRSDDVEVDEYVVVDVGRSNSHDKRGRNYPRPNLLMHFENSRLGP